MAFQIIRHAFSMIIGNLGQALRVSVGPYMLLILIVVAFFIMAGFPGALQIDPTTGYINPATVGSVNPVVVLLVPFLIAFGLFVFGWVAVSWHRFILLEEYSGALPPVSGRPIWPYIWTSFLYGLLLVLAAIPLFVIAGLIGSVFGPAFTEILFLGVGAIMTYIWFRIAIALPSVAIGKPIGLGAAWQASSSMSGVIFAVAVLLMVINGLAGIVIGLIASFAGIIAFALDLVVQWTLLMLGISILTTSYGHLIEKRPLIE